MKKRNAKTLVISLALMLVMCVATTLLSFSLADDTPGENGSGDGGSSFSTTKTNIDYIIENSATADKDETGRDLSPFYIVEVGSAGSDANSPLKAMVAEDLTTNKSTDDFSQFVKQVINGWSTQNKTMTPNKISYQYISVGSLTSTDAIDKAITAVSKADLIYVSNDPDSTYSSSRDIPEDLKLILSGAATSTYTPFIIDSPTKTANGNGGGTSATTFTNLAQQVFAKAGYYRNTFAYDTSASADIAKYMNRLDTRSKWLPISGGSKTANWYKDGDGKTTARILTIQSGDADNAVTAKFKESVGNTAYELEKIKAQDPTFVKDGKEAFEIKGTNFAAYGYRSTQKLPDNVVFEKMAAADLTADTDLGVYDLVIIEKGVSGTAISNDVKNMLSSMVYGMQHIVYDSTMTTSQGGEEHSDIITSPAVNYQYVVNKVADANEVSRFTNVLVTGMAEMRIYGAATAPSGVKAIADIINNGSYRGSGGGGSSSNLYTVLEIQPCYPIDLNLAKALQDRGIRSLAEKGRDPGNKPENDRSDIFYYIVPDSVLNNVTSDEITFDGGITSLSDMESTDNATTGISARGAVQNSELIGDITVREPVYEVEVEYKTQWGPTREGYANEISFNNDCPYEFDQVWDQAKNQNKFTYRRDASGNPIRLTAVKVDSNGNPIYKKDADGNPIQKKDASGNLLFEDKVIGTNAVDYYAWELSRAKVAYLTGLDYNKVNVVHMSSVEFNTSRETLLDNYDAIYIGGKNTAIKDAKYIATDGRDGNATVYNMYFHQGGTYSYDGEIGVLTGNDITYNRYVELQKYVTAGMPLIFTKAVSDAYYEAKTNTYQNTKMDPESNICKLMDLYMQGTATETKTDTGQLWYPTNKANVLAGFDSEDQIKVLNDGTYGTTYGGYVTIFGGVEKSVYVKGADGNTPVTLKNPDTTAVNAEEFSALLSSCSERPKFSLLQGPATYVEGDVSTEITGNSISFKFDVASKSDYTVTVYVDDNTNSRFEEKEVIYGPKKNPSGKITANFASSFDGALYWKFEVQSGECKSSVTGLSKVKVKNKNYVNVLQIAPDDAKSSKINGKTTLLFCTECQEARGILHGNRYSNTGKYSEASYYNGSCFYDDNYSVGGTLQNPATYDPGFNNPATGKELGIHRHNFGIVKYDSNYSLRDENGNVKYTGVDNWETNWAEDVYRDYDIDMDIWTTREFEANVKDAMTAVTGANAAATITNYKTLAAIYKNYYLTMKQVVDGSVDVDSTNYIYLKNKLTKTNASFVEADLNQLFGEEKAAYDLETAKGGFHVSEDELNSYRVAQKNLDSLLLSAKGKFTADKTWKNYLDQEIDYETTYHRYSDFYSLSNNHNISYTATYDEYSVAADGKTITSKSTTGDSNLYTEFTKHFRNWRNAKVYEEYFYKMYMKYLMYSTMKEYKGAYYPDLTEVYSCIVVGVGENFGDDDIKTTAAVNTLKYYVENDGNTFIFHQTINNEGSTPVLTNNLKTLFGQNYNGIQTKAEVKQVESLPYVIQGGTENNNTYPTLASGTLSKGQGLKITAHLLADNEGKVERIEAVANNTGVISFDWEMHDTNGNPATNTNYSNQRIRILLNGNDTPVYEFNPHSDRDGKSSGSVASIADTEVLEVTTAPNTDVNRYHYTPLTKSGGTIPTMADHLTMVNKGVWGNAEKFGRFMYTQTAVLNTDIQIPNSHINFISDISNYGAFTNRATQVNKGVVTMYPFLIASELKISETHPNSFSTDIENEDVVVYYALAGGAKGSKSSVVAADPQDGIDNYFLYSYGNVTYCGAGHTLLTGRKRDNNDERRLFINIILNSAKKSVFGPTIDVYDPYPVKNPDGSIKTDGEGNPVYTNSDITKAEDGSYETVVPSMDSVPEFTYRVTIPDTSDEVSHVKIYYDLSPNASAGEYGFVNGTDVSIFEADAKDDDSILKNKYKLISKAIKELALKPEYFRPYDNKYTYIVIAVKTRKGTVTLQRIMVKIAPKLWDMT